MSDEQIQKLGIDALKNVTGGAFHLVERVATVTSETSAGGKKVTIPEVIGSVGVVYDLGLAVINAKPAIAEIKDMDEDEENEFLEWAKVEFNLPNQKVKLLIVQCIHVLLELADTVEMFLALKKEEEDNLEDDKLEDE